MARKNSQIRIRCTEETQLEWAIFIRKNKRVFRTSEDAVKVFMKVFERMPYAFMEPALKPDVK